MSDFWIAQYSNLLPLQDRAAQVRAIQKSLCVKPCVNQIDTLAADFPVNTNHLNMTYSGDHVDIPHPQQQGPQDSFEMRVCVGEVSY